VIVGLINPRGIQEGARAIPHGLLQLHAELKRYGYTARIIDFNNVSSPEGMTALSRCDAIGISVMTTQLPHAAVIIDSVKNTIPVIWGGVHCLLDPESILRRYPGHYVVRGEGENALISILSTIHDPGEKEKLVTTRGVCFMDNDHRLVMNEPDFVYDLEQLADISYHDLPDLENYLQSRIVYFNKSMRTLGILTSRGCSWDCSFCINSIYRKYQARHRSKTISKIRRETEKIIDEYNIEVCIPSDEDFFINRHLLTEWTEYAGEKRFLWGANSRYNYFKKNIITPQVLKKCSENGLFYLGMSLETGDESLRNAVINKKVTDTDVYETIQVIHDSKAVNLAVNTSFIIDFPGDNRENKIKTIKWMNRLSAELNVLFSGPQVYRPYPGSRLYELEKTKETGNFEFYTKNVQSAGEFGDVAFLRRLEQFFYAVMVRDYFNARFTVLGTAESPVSRLQFSRLTMIMVSVHIRIHFDCWLFFIDPFILPLLYLCTPGHVWAFIKNRLFPKQSGSRS